MEDYNELEEIEFDDEEEVPESIRNLIIAALEKEGCSDVVFEYDGTDGGQPCYGLRFCWQDRHLQYGYIGLDVASLGKGSTFSLVAWIDENRDVYIDQDEEEDKKVTKRWKCKIIL